jgi:hypothetical protein
VQRRRHYTKLSARNLVYLHAEQQAHKQKLKINTLLSHVRTMKKKWEKKERQSEQELELEQ